jgi:thiol:disulfide interchange protein
MRHSLLVLALISLAACGSDPAPTATTAAPAAPAAATSWLVGWDAAVAQARTSGRPILADFTGSDWCPPCKRLKAEVFSTPAFATWAADKVVLLEVDFPRAGNQPPEVAVGNNALLDRFKVEGFPTILLLTADGAELGRLGYQPGGAEPWIAAADAILSKPR